MDTLLLLVFFGAGLLVLWIICKLLAVPVRILGKLVLNAVVGAIILIVINFIGGLVGFSLPITPFSALLTGVFGLPGVLLLFIFQQLL